MSDNPEAFNSKLVTVRKAWFEKAPSAIFGGMTLAQFDEAVKPSLAAREKIETGKEMIDTGTNERLDADVVSNEKVQLVVNGVKGDVAFGENSDLYEAMGYVRKSERASGLTHKKKQPPVVTPPAKA